MIKEIRIRNYRIFKGLHQIALSEDIKLPVTVISTITASGKTSLIDAVYWCLYGENIYNNSPMLNRERQNEMTDGEVETLEVSLVFDQVEECAIVSRSIAYKKSGDRLVRCRDLDRYYITGQVSIPPQSVAPAIFLTEAFKITERSYAEKIVSRSVSSYLSRLRIREAEKMDGIKNKIMEKIAAAATEVLNILYFRSGTYTISWKDDFKLWCDDYDASIHLGCLSATDQLVFNISLCHGVRKVLWENEKTEDFFPVFVDDIFMRSAPQQFSLDKLLRTLPNKQVIILSHENSLAGQQISNYCGQFYTMRRSSTWTSIEISHPNASTP